MQQMMVFGREMELRHRFATVGIASWCPPGLGRRWGGSGGAVGQCAGVISARLTCCKSALPTTKN